MTYRFDRVPVRADTLQLMVDGMGQPVLRGRQPPPISISDASP